MVDLWTGALTLTSVAVGAGLAELREVWKERKTKRRVAIALTAEVFAMADMVAECASLATFAEFGLKEGEDLNTHLLVARLPPEPAAYRALAGQLPLLDVGYGVGCCSVLWQLRTGQAAQHSARGAVNYSRRPRAYPRQCLASRRQVRAYHDAKGRKIQSAADTRERCGRAEGVNNGARQRRRGEKVAAR